MIEALAGRIEQIEIEEEMRNSFLDYAMSVIVSRALPDVRDGLKPVHRRIIYGMYEAALQHNKPHKKCARIVGDVMGKYHPHGDAAIYDTLVRMAQDFSYRYELVDGHGNFGSVDGDSAAAMRYTEARLSKISMELIRDIEQDTVDFGPNYDETLKEPLVMPARFPNLLVNGSAGIAVGMATNIPPHNIAEVIDATVHLIDQPEAEPSETMRIIKGPDFPTGGLIMGISGIKEAYETGRGKVLVRARAHTEQMPSGKMQIIVSELPYQVNKARLIEKIADLVREKKITGISDLRDESDRSGMRLVIELKRDSIPQVVLNNLYKHTSMQTTFGVNMLALVDGVPRVLGVGDALRHYIAHQKEVTVRRTRFELDKAEKRAHILEGLLIALANLDAVIKTIRSSKDVDEARNRLMEGFSLSAEQAQAILEMRLQKLTALESEKIEAEHKDLLERIAWLKAVLASDSMVMDLIKEDLLEIRKIYSDPRRTEIVPSEAEIELEDLIAEQEMLITITRSGYIKSTPLVTYRKQKRGGKGVAGMDLKDGDFIEHLFVTSNHHFILFFTNKGKVYRLKAHELPEGGRNSKGRAAVNVLPFEEGEKINTVIATKDFSEAENIIMATKKGTVKKTKFSLYNTSRREGIKAILLNDDDNLIGVRLSTGGDDVLLISKSGQAMRFNEKDVRSMGRTTHGVRGMRLGKSDEVINLDVISDDHADLFVISEKGIGKRTALDQYPVHHRGGKGVRTIKTTERTGLLVASRVVRPNQELMIISFGGTVIRVPVDGISRTGRSTQGVKVMGVRGNDRVSALARVTSVREDDSEDEIEEIEAES